MAVNEETRRLLPCGRDPQLVWAHADQDRLSVHEQGCRWCAEVVADAALLRAATRDLVEQPLDPPPGIVDRVMSTVRTELRREYLALPGGYGPAQVERTSAVAVLRDAVDRMPDVWARRCRIEPVEPREPTGTPSVRISMDVGCAYGTDLTAAAARAREVVRVAAERLLGLAVQRVDVRVVDVRPEAGGLRE